MAPKAPNSGHIRLAAWEKIFSTFTLITQNIDGLHQKAGTTKILELHGNIWKLRCTEEGTLIENQEVPLEVIPPLCSECKALLRPHVVWFGESLETAILQNAIQLSSSCEVILVIGTSSVVQPAASLPLATADAGGKIIEINPEVTPLTSYADFSIRGKAGEILLEIDEELNRINRYKGTASQ